MEVMREGMRDGIVRDGDDDGDGDEGW